MPIVELPPQIQLVCDECDHSSGEEEFGGFIVYDASDVERALSDADFHRLPDGRIVCDDCAYALRDREPI